MAPRLIKSVYSTPEVENEWKKQWTGKTFFSHGTNHGRGVLILVKDQLDFRDFALAKSRRSP